MNKKICMVGQFPPPIHGLSYALETLFNSDLQKEFTLEKVDIKNNKSFLKHCLKIINSKADLYYFTIAQSKMGNYRDLIYLFLMLLKKKKVIIHLHGGGFRYLFDNIFSNIQKRLNLILLKKVDNAIVLSDDLKYNFSGIVDDNKIVSVPNFVDYKNMLNENEIDLIIKERKNKKQLQILYLSNFIKEKGYLEVLEIAKILKENGDNRFKFVFAGLFFNDEDKKEFDKYIRVNDLSEIVEYKGSVYGEEKKCLLKSSDIFILLTRYLKEGQPISIIEAMANGLVIISTRHAGIPYLVNHNNGKLFKFNDYKEIINYLDYVYKNRDFLELIIKNNINRIEKEFLKNNYINNMIKVFKDCIGKQF